MKKNDIVGQDVTGPPAISMANRTPECVNTFSHFGSTRSSDLLIDTEVSIRLAKAAALVAKLLKRVWSDKDLTHSAQSFRYSELARIQQ